MTKIEMKNEISYKISIMLIGSLLKNGVITQAEYKKIDKLNQKSFPVEFAELYP